MKKLHELWDRLPKEVKVAIYIALSGAATALVDYLKVIELDNALTMAIINIVLVLLNNRKEFITSRIK